MEKLNGDVYRGHEKFTKAVCQLFAASVTCHGEARVDTWLPTIELCGPLSTRCPFKQSSNRQAKQTVNATDAGAVSVFSTAE